MRLRSGESSDPRRVWDPRGKGMAQTDLTPTPALPHISRVISGMSLCLLSLSFFLGQMEEIPCFFHNAVEKFKAKNPHKVPNKVNWQTFPVHPLCVMHQVNKAGSQAGQSVSTLSQLLIRPATTKSLKLSFPIYKMRTATVLTMRLL